MLDFKISSFNTYIYKIFLFRTTFLQSMLNISNILSDPIFLISDSLFPLQYDEKLRLTEVYNIPLVYDF